VAFPGLDFTRKEMTIVGSRASTRCFPKALELLASGEIHYPKIGTVVDFWEGPRIIREMDEQPGKYHKVVLAR
jgi:L-gulonate 5-dehydrogenase